MDNLLVASRTMALAMRIADDHHVVEYPVERLDELAPAPDVDAVVLDVGEPFTAMQALNRLRECGFTTPVLIVSGFQPSWKDVLGLSIDGVVVVPLPITRIALLEGIDRLLGRIPPEADPSTSPTSAPSPPVDGTAAKAQDSAPANPSPPNGSAVPSGTPAPRAADEPPARTGSPLAAPTAPSRGASPEPDLFRPVIEPSVPTRSSSVRPRIVPSVPSSHPPASPPASRPPASPPAAAPPAASRPAAPRPSTSPPSASRPATSPAASRPPATRNVAPAVTPPPAAPPARPQGPARSSQPTPHPTPPPGAHRVQGRAPRPATQPAPQQSPQPTPIRPSRTTPQQTPEPTPPQTPHANSPPAPGAHRAPQGHGVSPFGSLRSRDRGSDRAGERHPGFTPGDGVQAALTSQEGDEVETWVRGLLDRRTHLFGVAETAQVLADEVIERGESDAVAVLVPDGTRWRVSGGVGLRQLERRLLLDTSHWLISEIAVGGRALLIEDTDIVRPRLAGAPLAAWRHLLAVPVPEIRAAVVLARSQEGARFTERDLAAVVPVVAEAGPLLSAAMRMRELARALAPLRDVDHDR